MSRKVMCAIPFVLVLFFASDAFAEIPRDPNLVIYYPYEEVGAMVPDESGKGHNGTVCGDVSACPAGIKWYGAAEFLGEWGPTGYSYLDLDSPHYPAVDIPRSAITLAAWVECRQTGKDHAILSCRAADNTWVIHPQINNNETFRWLLRAPGGVTIFNLNGVGKHGWDEWLHYAGTYDSATGKGILYINGEVVASIDVPLGQPIADWGTGARVGYNIDNARPFTGVMDELYLYTRAMSQAEIKDLMVSDGLPTEKASHPWPANGAELDTPGTDLLWLPGAYAVSNNVYFGERFEDVNNGTGDTFKGNQTEAKFSVAGLTWGTTYYWRIDGVNAADPNSPWKGNVWSFLLRPQTAWNPDPADGAKWIDSNADLSWSPGRGAVTHSVYFGESLDDVNNAAGAPSQTETTYKPAGPLGFEKVYYWRVDEFDGSATHKGNVWQFSTMRSDSGIKGEYYTEDFKTLVLTRKDPGINFNWGAAAPDPQVPADNFSVRWTGELEVPFTSDWTFTANCDDWVRLWVDNQLLFDKWGQQSGVEWIGTINLAQGQKYSIVMEYYENTGDARATLYWNSPYWLSPYQPKQVIPQGAFSLPLRARSPKPANGAADAKDAAVLSWTAGDTADKHDVYFGTDQAAVEGATTATAGIYRGRQALDAATYTPAEAPLEWGRTYYWRIDEVEAGGVTVHKGNLWNFTVGEFFVVDDFESYNDIDPPDPASHRIFEAWIDGYSTPTTNGALVGNEIPPYTERANVHGGDQAMPLSYSNVFKSSEATLTLSPGRVIRPGQDWTRNGVGELSLWFRGLAANAPERMYVVLNGTKVVYHTDPAA
ncbi:MAG TPA: PA14 domain-containing protein, partial [Sedimentisphaerales bacterium]|nr:PA14 domain-containing protein [Sedimentisphaerales bacterium]